MPFHNIVKLPVYPPNCKGNVSRDAVAGFTALKTPFAEVITESAYEYNSTLEIKPLKIARTELVTVLMQPWFQAERISRKILKNDLKAIEMDRFSKKKITDLIDDYVFCGGILSWDENDIHELQKLVKAILGISNGEFERIIMEGSPEELQYWVSNCTVPVWGVRGHLAAFYLS